MIKYLNHININCRDLDVQLAFYKDVLGCETVVSGGTSESGAIFETMGFPGKRGARTEVLAVGGKTRGALIELIEWAEVGKDCTATPRDVGIARIGFIVDDVDDMYREFKDKGVKVLGEPHEGGVGPARVRALFFLDPEGNLLEVLQHLGRGDPPTADAPTKASETELQS
jgi:catechol 2,3-dioxygenase-like lactoylglutathione lyase family enzyme